MKYKKPRPPLTRKKEKKDKKSFQRAIVHIINSSAINHIYFPKALIENVHISKHYSKFTSTTFSIH